MMGAIGRGRGPNFREGSQTLRFLTHFQKNGMR